MSAVIDLKDHKAAPCQIIDVGGVTFCGAVSAWRDIAVIEDNGLKTAFGRFDKGDGQQAVYLIALRDIADQVLVIIGTIIELLFESDLTADDL